MAAPVTAASAAQVVSCRYAVSVRENHLAEPFISGSVVVATVFDIFVAAIAPSGAIGLGYTSAFEAGRARVLAWACRRVCGQFGNAAGWPIGPEPARRLRQGDDVGLGGALGVALGVMELALLEVAAIEGIVPVATLVNGGPPNGAASYLSGGSLDASPADLRDLAGRARGLGLDVVKVKVDGRHPASAAARVLGLVDSGLRVAADANQTFTLDGARDFLERVGVVADQVAWLEEPLDATDVAGHRRLRELGVVPIAAGETVFGREGVQRFVDERAVDRLILSIPRVGGPRSFLEIGDAAARLGVAIAAHVQPHLASHLLRPDWADAYVEYLPWWDHYFQPDAYDITGGLRPAAAQSGFGYQDALRADLAIGGDTCG